MEILHPLFTIVFIVLIGFSFKEVYGDEIKNYKAVWFVVIAMILLSGLRKNVGADYPVYKELYSYFGLFINFSEVFDKALFRENTIEIEWLYVFFNKVFFDLGLPFYMLTLFVAIFSISLKFWRMEKEVAYPAFALMIYMIPSYFIADSGQIRQGLGMAVCAFSYRYIKSRNLPMFLLFIYIALGFHKSSIVFLPAYWLATVRMNSTRILILISVCVLLAPFQIYNNLGFLSSIAPQEIYSGYTGYIQMEGVDEGRVGLLDLIMILYVFFLVSFDKITCEKIPYYEYIRNLGVFGICLYFVMRGSPIFSTRLPGIYLFFMTLVVPNIIASIEKISLKRYLHFVLVCFVVFYYFVFAQYQARGTRFLPDSYNNYLWDPSE